MKDLHNSNPSGYTSTICFHAQQAVEKYLIPRTHDVDYLVMECQKIDSESFNLDLKSLTEFGVSVRYPDDFFIPSPDESNEYTEIAIEVSKIVEKLIAFPE